MWNYLAIQKRLDLNKWIGVLLHTLSGLLVYQSSGRFFPIILLLFRGKYKNYILWFVNAWEFSIKFIRWMCAWWSLLLFAVCGLVRGVVVGLLYGRRSVPEWPIWPTLKRFLKDYRSGNPPFWTYERQQKNWRSIFPRAASKSNKSARISSYFYARQRTTQSTHKHV